MIYAAQWTYMGETPGFFEDRPCTILAWRQAHTRYLIRMPNHRGTLDVPAWKLRSEDGNQLNEDWCRRNINRSATHRTVEE